MAKDYLNTLDSMRKAGVISGEKQAEIAAIEHRYAVGITSLMAQLIDPEDPNDPIALQFVPQLQELERKSYEREDPIGDAAHTPVPGLVHRYQDRVLLKLFHTCPLYCRFCFRRESVGPGGENFLHPQALDQIFTYLENHQEIWEVIFTGGDPLMLAPRRLREICARLSSLSHIHVIRFHTRIPLVDPDRIHASCIEALQHFPRAIWIALHANHPKEFTPQGTKAIRQITDQGIAMVSQTVLLKGVNDHVDILARLMRTFVAHRIKPYYIHHLDPAPGTDHFRVSLARGRAIMRTLSSQLSGLCQPAYMLDLPGGYGKSRVDRGGVRPRGNDPNVWEVEDFRGHLHVYREPTNTEF